MKKESYKIMKEYQSIESYKEAIDILDIFTKIILFSFAEHGTGIKDIIIRNFIARGIVALKGILKLYEIDNYHDCWVLHRCILDRLFHLRALDADNKFEIFEKWSFKKQYEFKNKVRSDPEFKERVNPDYFKEMEKKRKKYDSICKEQPHWKRPKPETIAREMDLMFLYKYGYDYASTLVHPMANDGEADFLRQTKLATEEIFTDQRVVINNSCLAVVVLIQEGLNICDLLWRRLVFDFLGNFRSFLISGSEKYKISFYKIGILGPDADLCKKKGKD
ncbi:MAG: DUF5677 domain-containing protein [Candidatus Helarchaeota archaeon]